MTVFATRTTQDEARAHFEQGGRILISDRGHEVSAELYPGINTHRKDSTTFDELVEMVRMWRNRHPNQRFYIVPDVIYVDLVIDNIYVDGGQVVTHWKGFVPSPPAKDDSSAFDDWAYEHLFSKSGTGKEEGDAGYFVKVERSWDASLVGRKFEWGV